jgi:hypothetical protein
VGGVPSAEERWVLHYSSGWYLKVKRQRWSQAGQNFLLTPTLNTPLKTKTLPTFWRHEWQNSRGCVSLSETTNFLIFIEEQLQIRMGDRGQNICSEHLCLPPNSHGKVPSR